MDDSEEYDMNHLFRGHAIIIANEKFAGDTNRPGARQDANKMQALFQSLDFLVTTYMNVTAADMMDIIRKGSKSFANLDADCFVLVISSHGLEKPVFDSSLQGGSYMYLPKDSTVWRHALIGSDNKLIFVDEILKIFDDQENKDSYLKGKPKLFFLQACRSGHLSYKNGILGSYDTGTNVKVSISDTNLTNIQPSDAGYHDEDFIELVNSVAGIKLSQEAENATDGMPVVGRVTYDYLKSPVVETDPVTPVTPRVMKQSAYDIVPVPCPDDCLIMYPTVPGKYAYRINQTGSYMLSYMFHHAHRNKLLRGCDILQYLTSVNNAMASTEIYFDPSAITVVPDEIKMLQESLPFKVTACIVHRLTKTLRFQPRSTNSVWQELNARRTF
ncbi:caspase-like [Ruditapes philippinarum]|uniref:caspase-like n=1 Tax=Ruditapes philippinarum TaxID=129788 RepID=UPI00295C3165|nr:caspase-like [Ruditapes philippinarum]